MKEFKIACGSMSRSKNWKNTTVTWEDLCHKLQTVTRTRETAAEYQGMSRDERAAIKDRGGFVGGQLKGRRRKVEEVVCRSLLTFDVDECEPEFMERFLKRCEYAAILYSTHSHTPLHPRVRIIIPLKEDVTPDVYVAVARLYAAEWSIDQFDACSFRVNQMMYWPTASADGEYLYKILDGPCFDAVAYLERYPDWQDTGTLPTTSRENRIRERDGRKQEDPLLKGGTVGAFCRTYSIQDAIDKYLSDVYEPSTVEGRYDFIAGEGKAGLVVYEDRFAYSHHATDPAYQKQLNAFDLVRIHKFGDDDPRESYNKMRMLAERDDRVRATLIKERLEESKRDFDEVTSSWEVPIPFGKHMTMEFPADALPPALGDYVLSLSESLQTPVDMAGCSVLAVAATCAQGKFVVQGKEGWQEPLNIYEAVISQPSERKSAVESSTTRPISIFENEYNRSHATEIEASRMEKRILDRKQKALEDMISKGKADKKNVQAVAREITEFVEVRPLRLFADDVTPEKLASMLAANKGRMALLSSEAGIFDTLSGAYSKVVNIDVLLKSYSGDQIRVDRIGRESESIQNPTLTILLMAQPSVISKVLSNEIFSGRGLTARFLYSMPESMVGKRQFDSAPVPDHVYHAYESAIFNMLEDDYPEEPEVITLSPEASQCFKEFSEELEPLMAKEYGQMSNWCGKLAGNTLRIAGILCRACDDRPKVFLKKQSRELVVDEQTMENAIRLGRYFLNHAMEVFNALPENSLFQGAQRILKMITEKHLKEFNRRAVMRNCQVFQTAADVQPALDFLEEYGYIASLVPAKYAGKGRPAMPKYLVNPWVERSSNTLLS